MSICSWKMAQQLTLQCVHLQKSASESFVLWVPLEKLKEITEADKYEDLINLVCCFIKYTESSADYRNAVIEGN